jgi:L-Ala-D/L-Glu epimerase
MQLIFRSYLLQFKHPFGVSSNTRKETESIFIRIESENKFGYGEACLPAYLGETSEETISFLNSAAEFLRNYDAALPLNFFLNEIDKLKTGCNAAKAALDMALHDLYGKISERSYAKMMGISLSEPRQTSFTIGIDTEEKLEQKIREATDFQVLKIKAGTEDDKKLIGLIRKFTDKPLYVDVNQGWKDKHMVLDMLYWLKTQKVILVEQPMPKEMLEEMCWVTEQSPIITIADESVKRLSDLEKIDGAFSGINIKLMKCTGLREAMRMINFCKKNDLVVLLGCMAESSCATTAMAQLMQFADYIDLDAPLLYKNDPFKGVSYLKGKIMVNAADGLGIEPVPGLFA